VSSYIGSGWDLHQGSSSSGSKQIQFNKQLLQRSHESGMPAAVAHIFEWCSGSR
jgi:hypothetical protein